MWLCRGDTQKFMIIEPIYELLEGFSITMATRLDVKKKLFREDNL